MNINVSDVQDKFDEFEFECDATIENLENNFKQIKAGRANPYILDQIRVDYYGTPTPIKQLGNITVPEARILMISVWDASALKLVEKAILASNIGITPNNDGKVLRLIFPELTAEKRRDIVKEIKNSSENAKVALRNHRRDINDALKKFRKDNLITEDDQGTYEKEVDKILASKIDSIDKLFKEKEKEILSV